MKKPYIVDRIFGVILISFIVLTTSSCQATPETAPVVNKGGGRLEEMIASSAVSAAPGASIMEIVGAPETFKDSYANEKGDVTVNINAAVEVPSVEALPAVRARISDFTQEQADRIGEYFFKGAPLFSEEQVRTKAEIEESIIDEEQYLKELKDQFTGIRDEEIEESERYLEGLKEQYEQAPEERKRTPATLELKSDGNGTGLYVLADLGKETEARLTVNNTKEFGNTLTFRNKGDGDYDPYSDMQGKQTDAPKGMVKTLKDAEDIVARCLSDLGIKGMQIEYVRVATYYTWDDSGEGHKIEDKQCYAFSLTRVIGGIAISNIEGSTPLGTDDPNVPEPEEPDYSLTREPEELMILVDDTGIVQFSWTNPTEEIETLSEHVTLMPFDEVVKRAKDNIFFKNYTAYGSTAEIKITSVRLGMMRIVRKDKPGEYLIVPVWDFIGNNTSGFAGHEDWLPFGDQSFVTINAIDGSNINRDWGY